MTDWSCSKCKYYEWGCEFQSWYGNGEKGDCPNFKLDLERIIAEEVKKQLSERKK